MNYIDKEFVTFYARNKTGLVHPNTRDSRLYKDKRGKKLIFSSWVSDSLLRFHKKQVEAIKIYGINYKLYIKMYDQERYKEILRRDKISSAETYIKNREYKLKVAKIYKQLKKQVNQPELL